MDFDVSEIINASFSHNIKEQSRHGVFLTQLNQLQDSYFPARKYQQLIGMPQNSSALSFNSS